MRREVVIAASDDLLRPLQGVVQQEAAVHPGIAALPILDPALHGLDLIEEAGQSSRQRFEGLQVASAVHAGESGGQCVVKRIGDGS
jgi:hypothetical protein